MPAIGRTYEDLDVNERINLRQIMQQYLEIFEDRLIDSQDRLNIGRSGKLWRSIQSEARPGQGLFRASISFLFYGRFVDMGAGRGLRAFGKRAKKWYSPVKYSQVARLREILAEEFSIFLASEVESVVPQRKIVIDL